MVLGHRQQVIDDFEPLGALGIVDAGDLHQLLIVELVAQGTQHVGDAFARDVDRNLVDLVLGRKEGVADRGFHRVDDALAGRNEGSRARHRQRSIVPSRRIFRCNCMMP